MVSWKMELRRAGYVVSFVILLCALAIASSEARTKTVETIISNGAGCRFTSSGLDGDTGERACLEELAERDLYAPEEFVPCIPKEKIHETIKLLPPNRKQEFLDCLRRKSALFHASIRYPSVIDWFIKPIELIFVGQKIPKRNLIGHSHRMRSHSAAARATLPPSTSPMNSPFSSPMNSPFSSPINAPSPSAATPAISPSLDLHPPVKAPTPSLTPDIDVSDPPPASHTHVPRSHAPPRPSKKHDNNPTATIAAVLAAGLGAIIAFALLLFCCCNGVKNKVDPKDGQRDERPLLNLSLSELSGDSSQKSFSLGNSTTKELAADKGNQPSFGGNLSGNPENGNEGPNSDAYPSAMPPLKPPPGRSDAVPAPPAAAPPPPPPPAPRAPPPPPMKVARPPPVPPATVPGKSQPLPMGPHRRGPSTSSVDGDSGSQKAKLKPFFWDKVLANPDQSMVWHEISAGSFQFNEEMMESLFGYSTGVNNNSDRRRDSPSEPAVQYIKIIDAKKAQNLSILLKALNVTTEEVVDALQEGNSELPLELLQTLLKMAPTTEEELKLRLFTGELTLLGPAERFLKVLVDIPFAFKRLESLLFMISMEEDMSNIRESFATLQIACNKLRNSRLFLKLLEAVLKTGNRMNDGTYRGGALAFKLDTLLKLADVKGTDGKTTLLHFVVQEIIRSEGIRAARSERESRSQSSITSASGDSNFEDFADDSAENYRQLGLQVVSGLSSELEDIKRAAAIDADSITGTVSKLSQSLFKTSAFLNAEMKSLEEDSKFYRSLSEFMNKAEADISWISEEEKRIMSLVKSTADYFHGNSGKDEGLRLFTIVRDFLIVLDKTCKQVKEAAAKQPRNSRRETPRLSVSSPQNSDVQQRLFPAIAERRVDDDSSSSDDESSSSSS